MKKRDDEAFLDRVRIESGVFDGKFPIPPHDDFIVSQKEDVGSDWAVAADGDSRPDSSPLEAAAGKILRALSASMKESRAKLPALFKFVNRGAAGILEPAEFLEGLVRLGIVEENELSPDTIVRMMVAVDPEFDGRIYYTTLNRAISMAVRPAGRTQAPDWATRTRETAPAATYGESLPFEAVKVDLHARSLYFFDRSFEKFRRQQKALLHEFGETASAGQVSDCLKGDQSQDSPNR